ncbi:Zinc and ring finger 2 [Paragonimus heterotremus]|uniref:RING-type E3 ubiquitin transferase n=1 Tax=Paragonimus heterotremus TaxID=100268 RepID=A0A8J4WIV5_9TREM|nr:Zinc and ring finger 2 [Paragonimus heterotremus]
MGLRLSLDSSGSESNGGPTSTANRMFSYEQPHSQYSGRATTSAEHSRLATVTGNADNNSGQSFSDRGCTVEENPRSMQDIIRELERTDPDDVNLIRLLYPHSNRAARLGGRLGAHRSNSLSTPSGSTDLPATSFNSTEPASTSIPQGATRSRSQRHQRSSWLGPEIEPSSGRLCSGRPRRSEPGESRLSHWDSSDTDSEDGDLLRLSSLMLRHFQLGSTTSGRTRPRTESDLVRALRASAARVTYNVDRLTQAKGECAICLEELAEGNVIARLPCLCVYHKKCIDSWFKRRPVCPEHPGD